MLAFGLGTLPNLLLAGMLFKRFRDFTRIAASHPAIWTDVSFANQDSLLQLIDAQQQELQRLKDLILAGDAQALYAYYDQAQQQRDAWPPQPVQ